MRQRKTKDVDLKLKVYENYLPPDGKINKGIWNEIFTTKGDIYLELGCGKGQFIVNMAKKHLENNYIGAEGQPSVILRAIEKAADLETNNIKFITGFIYDITEYFEEDELSGIYLNFSDPWPKDRHAKRRLTHNRFIKGFKNVVKPGSFLEFKTDNSELFEFTIEEILAEGLTPVEITRDLHSSLFTAKEITTEYEDKFNNMGEKINFLKVKLK